MGITNNARPLVAAGIALAVGACSWFGGETPPRRAGAATTEPNLASVPAKPTPILTPEQRKALTQDLVRDRENARYSNQEYRIGNVPEAAPPRPAPRPAPAARRAAPAPAAAAAVTQRPSDDIVAPAEARREDAAAVAAAAEKESDDSPWWWPFGGSSGEKKTEPTPRPAPTGPTVDATPENMQAAPGVMPVTGKPLPQPEQSADMPAPIAMAPVPPTPPPGSGVPLSAAMPPARSNLPPPPAAVPAAPAVGGALPRAPDAAVIPVPPPISTDAEPSQRMQPDAIGAAPPPPPALAAVPAAPPPRVATGPGTSRLVSQVEFAETGSALTDAARDAVAEVEKLHRERGGRIRLVALTPRGSAQVAGDAMLAAAAAATERAQAVQRELVRLGVPEGDIAVSTAPSGTGRDVRRVDAYLDN
ncbi:hypothetical protein STAQ_24860 [Allostella sp. ATCC 35155]|nr:hypothetical protein STAQ_24860 [Stella sp. ATCC 35155]